MSSRRKDREIFEIVTFIRGPSAGPLQTGMCSLDVGIKSAGWSREETLLRCASRGIYEYRGGRGRRPVNKHRVNLMKLFQY
ncbi:hypothetical protein MTP99_006110 [Tenebrio molitor]|nr:hypothetical protein MTP99_006110 [Tenebrio molitor]